MTDETKLTRVIREHFANAISEIKKICGPDDFGRYHTQITEMEKTFKRIENTEHDSMTVMNNIARNKIKTGTFDECHKHNSDAPVFHLPGAKEYCKVNTKEQLKRIIQLIRMQIDGTSNEVCIEVMIREDKPFNMCFVYSGNKVDNLKTTLQKIYPGSTVSLTSSDIIVNDRVDNLSDYMRQYKKLITNQKMKPFIADMKSIDFDYKDGLEYGYSFVKFDHEVGMLVLHHILQPICQTLNINIDNSHHDNRVYNIKNNSGSRIALGDLITSSGIEEKKMNFDYLKWISENHPDSEELRSAYFKRIKKAVPSFHNSKQFHNKIMRALGWKEKMRSKGRRCWGE
jgi:hypothetical protein